MFFVIASFFNFIPVTDNRILIGSAEIERTGSGNVNIVASNNLGFGGFTDGFLGNCDLQKLYPTGVTGSLLIEILL